MKYSTILAAIAIALLPTTSIAQTIQETNLESHTIGNNRMTVTNSIQRTGDIRKAAIDRINTYQNNSNINGKNTAIGNRGVMIKYRSTNRCSMRKFSRLHIK